MQKAKFTAKQLELERMRDRKAAGASLKENAKAFGVHISTVSAYLRGERKPE